MASDEAHQPPSPSTAHHSPMTHHSPVAQHQPLSPATHPSPAAHTPPVNPNPDSVHPMVTRYRVGTNRPTQRLNLHASSVFPLPKSYRGVFNDPNWQNAMCDEYNALIKNRTWTLVPRPPDTNIVRCMWLFRHMYLVDGTLNRYKARLVANDSTQLERVDVDETFSLVVKPGTIQTVLSLAASRHWSIHQLDVENAFLHGYLSETVYMHQPLRAGLDTAYLLLYVDDIVLTASSKTLLQWIISSLHQEFSMTYLGSLNYFLDISVIRDSLGIFISQSKYATEILERDGMVGCNSSRTPVDIESKLGDDGDPVSDLTLYRSLAGSLEYLTVTHLVAYSDADWAGFPTTRLSTSGYYVFLGNNLLSWSSKHQPTLSRSNAKAKYRGVVNDVAETCWYLALGWQLEEIHVTWAHLDKKRTRLRTYTKSMKKYCSQSVETASQA
ncbi:ribonuclease H-like domain-containing protein [Tanacetum coccineum]